jgi:hypothetical protein
MDGGAVEFLREQSWQKADGTPLWLMPVQKTKQVVGTSTAQSKSKAAPKKAHKASAITPAKLPGKVKVPVRAKAKAKTITRTPAPKETTSATKMAAKSKKVAGKMAAQKIAATGLTSRIRGHVSARGRRAQAARNKR